MFRPAAPPARLRDVSEKCARTEQGEGIRQGYWKVIRLREMPSAVPVKPWPEGLISGEVQSQVPELTNAELVQLRIRVIALENLVIRHCHIEQVEAVIGRDEARLRHWNRVAWLAPGRQ
jgi:hypothetical protein